MCSIENHISMDHEKCPATENCESVGNTATEPQNLMVKWHKAMKTAYKAQILLQEHRNKKDNGKHKAKENESESETSSSSCDSEIEIISWHRRPLEEHHSRHHHNHHHGGRQRSRSRGHDRKRDRSRSRGRSRGHSRGHSRGRSRGHSRGHSRGRSRGYSATRDFPSGKSTICHTHLIENRLPLALTI
uniref:Uncharacterized protein n=1 Tax=Musca domestica TaxID=7370 RepID=A0A1I8NGX7_MUSDO